jgi:hypothetical protein
MTVKTMDYDLFQCRALQVKICRIEDKEARDFKFLENQLQIDSPLIHRDRRHMLDQEVLALIRIFKEVISHLWSIRHLYHL